MQNPLDTYFKVHICFQMPAFLANTCCSSQFTPTPATCMNCEHHFNCVRFFVTSVEGTTRSKDMALNGICKHTYHMCTFLDGTRSLIPTIVVWLKKNLAFAFGLPIMGTSKVPTKEQHKPVAPMSKVAGAMTRRTCQLAQVEGGWDISDSSPRKMESSSHVAKIQRPQESHSSLKTNIAAQRKTHVQDLTIGGTIVYSWEEGEFETRTFPLMNTFPRQIAAGCLTTWAMRLKGVAMISTRWSNMLLRN